MKTLLIFIISILILLIVFEMFCENTKLSGFIRFAFSALIVFSAMTFLVRGIDNISLNWAVSEGVEENHIELANSQKAYLENIIETRLHIEKDVECDVVLAYEIDANNVITYTLAEIYITRLNDEKVEAITKIVQEYIDCEVRVYV